MSKFDSDYPLRLKNNAGEQMPAWAIAEVTGTEITNGEFVLIVDQVSSLTSALVGSSAILVVNSSLAVDDAGYGYGQWACDATWFGYTTGDGTPAVGERWGFKQDTWLLKKNYPGTSIIGQPDSTNGLVVARFDPVDFLLVKLDGALAQATNFLTGAKSATASVYIGSGTAGGTPTDSGNNITVYNRDTGNSFASGDYGMAGMLVGEPYFNPLEC